MYSCTSIQAYKYVRVRGTRDCTLRKLLWDSDVQGIRYDIKYYIIHAYIFIRVGMAEVEDFRACIK